MKFYLANKYSLREEMEQKALYLESLDWESSCRWVFGNEEGLSDQDICTLDLDDVEAADILILFTYPREEPQPGGGRFVEYGYALALGTKTVVIGPRENVFVNCPYTRRLDTWEEFLKEYL